ncbi:hypothetical protein ACNQFN_08280 [Thauera butanivorans]|uniref:hypothetical protein n=1 Tax=Thauera butanivorans TaxID=86174 RepID=UPI003AB1577A
MQTLNDFDPRRENDPNKRERLRQIQIRADRIPDDVFSDDPEVIRLRAQLEEAMRAEEATRDAPMASPKQIDAAITETLGTIHQAENRIGAAVLEDMADESLHFRTARLAHQHLADARLRLELLQLAKQQAARPRFLTDEQSAAREHENRTRRQLNDHLRLRKLQRAAKEI